MQRGLIILDVYESFGKFSIVNKVNTRRAYNFRSVRSLVNASYRLHRDCVPCHIIHLYTV